MSGYDFSPLFHGSSLFFSPGTTFLAVAYENRVIIRSSASLQIVRTWECKLPPSTSLGSTSSSSLGIDEILWSGDSMYILVYSSFAKQAWVFALSSESSEEIARIGGIDGLIRVEWGRGKEVLAWSDHATKLSIYDLTSGSTSYIQYPKSHQNCHTYSPDGKYLAVAERHFGKEHVGIYNVLDSYRLIRHFPLLTTDVQGLLWSPCGKYIAAWDNALSYSLHIHSPIGPHLTHFSSSSPTFSPTSSTEDPGLGIRTISWAPGGRWISIGGWDGKVRIVESEGWRCVAVLQWGTRTAEKDVAVWREPADWLKETRGRGIVQFDQASLPASIPTIRADFTRPNPRIGISQISFDREATLLLVRLDTSPNVIHIHTFLATPASETPNITHLAMLVFINPVKMAKWCPEGKKLSVVTKDGAVYFWQGDGEGFWEDEDVSAEGSASTNIRGGMMEGVGIPSRTEFSASEIHWSPDGSALAIQDKQSFCLLYDDPSASEGGSIRWDQVKHGQADGLTHIYEEEEGEEEDQSSISMRISLYPRPLVSVA